ncbi:uncharacterized protein G2W53_034122 [Senna tora]|uniref:Uncharacterized protein n=1 Tax=Senna tora TaxID=362788 RepID=A0A834T0R8_9FABA|nr:uncharacterized protein G2W53_034122 [Senna tora]
MTNLKPDIAEPKYRQIDNILLSSLIEARVLVPSSLIFFLAAAADPFNFRSSSSSVLESRFSFDPFAKEDKVFILHSFINFELKSTRIVLETHLEEPTLNRSDLLSKFSNFMESVKSMGNSFTWRVKKLCNFFEKLHQEVLVKHHFYHHPLS